MKFLKALFYLTLVLTVTGEIFRLDLGNNIAVRLIDITALGCLLSYIYLQLKNKTQSIDRVGKAILFFALVGLISLVLNSYSLNYNQLIVSFLYWLRWISYASIYFTVRSIGRSSNLAIEKILIVTGIVILCFGYLQYFLYPSLRNLFYLGWDEHNYRMFSVFLDPNYSGCFFVLYIIFLLGLLHQRSKKKLQQEAKTIFLGLFLAIPAVFLTYSRSALFMLFGSTVLYILLIKKKKLLLLLLIVFLVFLTVLSPTFNKENTNLLRATSSFARLESYERSLEIIKDHPIIGVGFNAYRYADESYGISEQNDKFANHAGAGSDSSILFVLATTGIIGLLVYMNIWIKILHYAYIKHNKSNNKYSIIVMSSVIGLFINSLFINSLFFPAIMLWTWVIVGFMESE